MKDFKPLEHYKLNDMQFNDNMTGMIMKLHVSVIDKIDQAIVDAVIETAREEGMTDLYILDKKFVIDALKEKIAREKESNNV